MQKNRYLIIFILSILHFLFDSSPGYAQQGFPNQRDCLDYTVKIMSGDSVRLIPNGDYSTMSGEIAKKIDLNFDGFDDLIVNFGWCGNWGDCIYGIYAQVADGKYTCVFQPTYWYSGKWDLLENEYSFVNGVRWMKLRLYSRTDYGSDSPGLVPTSFLQFDGKSYENLALQSLSNWPKHIDKTETFGVEKEFQYQGKTYQVGRLLLKDFKYGALTLRIIVEGSIMDICAPKDTYPDLEMSHTRLIQLHNRPFFFIIDRYRVYLIDLEQEKISARIEPGQGVEYGDDSMSGTVDGFQFFDQDQYLIGNAVSYGLFCFNISDLDHPKELKRYSSDFSDQGQYYFFLEQQPNGRWNGLVAQSDTLKKSSYISSFYTETKKAKYLFQDVQLLPLEDPFVDPAVDPAPKPFVLLYEKDSNGKKIPWMVDLKKGKLIAFQ